MERVIVKVRGEQTGIGGETDSIEMIAEGRHYYKDGKHYILYDDHLASDAGEVKTMLTIEPDMVALRRSGDVTHEQTFALGDDSFSEYQTPFGSLSLGVHTDKLDVVYGNVTGTVDVAYAMSINGTMQSRNTLHVEVNIVKEDARLLN
ncbi:MAG: DUF1934 domain-containing protein [Schwartzia sp.]|nr:DUF1934 domain-containing protein [Schwartzia sp. (in: firmicutes)]